LWATAALVLMWFRRCPRTIYLFILFPDERCDVHVG
jgi:hypothetical protein